MATQVPSTAPAATSTSEWMPASTRDCATSRAIRKASVEIRAAWRSGSATIVMAAQAAKAAAACPDGSPPRRGVPRPVAALIAITAMTVTIITTTTRWVGERRTPDEQVAPRVGQVVVEDQVGRPRGR